MAAFMSGQKLDFVALLDSEAEGKRVREELVKSRIVKKRQVLPFGADREMDLEDLIPEDFYLQLVQDAYSKEFKGAAIKLPEKRAPRIVKALEDYFRASGLPLFQKTRPANLLLRN